ncbi:MAG: 16S rRNA (cytosine(967)-C(5))-methyltransferase RsmB [Clostridia bacterium]|jgi:16S rRNA (cytosine967-C5)-methyltransferase|nr:16S rRNA (cytosine(967)-C(5))-methyltransferase RsmB [Clostridia bacterium]
MTNPRELALKAIYDIEFKGAYSNMALKKYLKSADNRDKSLVTALVYGTVDRKITLDYVIGRLSKIKIKKISKYILIILRMGIYQMMYMDKIPDSAAVNESVKLARRYGHGASVGFVNGVLRSAAGFNIEYPNGKTEYLSVKYSFPMWLCEKWLSEFGFEFTEQLIDSFGKSAPLTLRANTLKITASELSDRLNSDGINAEVYDGAVVCDGFDIEHNELYRDGFFTVQDIAAQQAAKILNPISGDMVIDMCAAPAGKTTHMAELMKNTGKIYAFDIYEHKIELIKRNAERLGIKIIEPRLSDGETYDDKLCGTADKVLCDVPCSGLGIIRRKPEIKWNREQNTDLPKIQRNILNNAAKYLKIGGELLYSTCTIENEENGAVTGAFLKDNGNFEKLYEKTYYPHIDNTDGFYICKMRRNK